MKAIRISAIGKKLTQVELPAPTPAAGEVLVAVKAAGICHSDAHYRSGIVSLFDSLTCCKFNGPWICNRTT